MYHRPLVPTNFAVPDGLQCGSYHLRMLSIDDVEKDLEAVLASSDRLKGLFGPESTWPDGVNAKEDLIDLAWHEREFTIRHSFAYTVMASDESRCLGCVYFFPSNVDAFDAVAFYWVRAGDNAEARDRKLGDEVRDWLARSWPFRAVAFPGRDMSWADWVTLQPSI